MSEPVPVTLPCQHWGKPDSPTSVLLIHGLGGAAGTWWRVAELLAEHGCTVTAPDLRGHGTAPFTSRYRISDYEADLDRLGAHWSVIVGQSLGGVIALRLAGRADALVLLDPVLTVPDELYEAVTRAQLRAVNRPGDPARLQELNPDWHPGDVLAAAKATAALSPWVVEQTMQQNRPWHHFDRLAGLTTRTHILGADPAHGAFAHRAAIEPYFSDTISFESVPGSSHSVYRDAPELVVERIQQQTGRTQP